MVGVFCTFLHHERNNLLRFLCRHTQYCIDGLVSASSIHSVPAFERIHFCLHYSETHSFHRKRQKIHLPSQQNQNSIMKFLNTALLVIGWTSSSTAFTIAPRNGASVVASRSSFVATRQLQVALSDPNVAADAIEDGGESSSAEMELDPLSTEEVVSAIGETGGEDISMPAPEHKIYVGNLPYSATVDLVRSMFEDADIPVMSVSLPTNANYINEESGLPSSKGFAFVTVESEDLVEKGIAALHQTDLNGRALRVNKLLPKEELDQAPRRSRSNEEGTYDCVV
jgi:cold-inducible RNA-binding protein